MILAFPKNLRLLTAHDYRRVFNASKKVRLGCKGVLLIATQNGCDIPRLGIIIAKREVASAVTRNTCKRIIRESFRYHQQNIANYDCIVIVKSAIKNVSRQQLRANLDRLWQKLT